MSETTGTPPETVARSKASDSEPLKPTSIELAGGGATPPPPNSGSGGGDGGGGDDDEESMTKMSFLEHLEELRSRIMRSLIAVAIGFCLCFGFSEKIYEQLTKPILEAQHKVNEQRVKDHIPPIPFPDTLFYSHPTDGFNIQLKIALVMGLFLVAPYVLAQLWGFISPGLYKREKKYAVPFVVVCSTLFLAGGAFGYFIAFPYALEFLLGIGGKNLTPMIMAKEYLDIFTTLIIGLGLIFEMPILILLLSLLHVVTPQFLLRNFRYAVLVITIVAAVVTPTTDVMNMLVFMVPMIALYFLGVMFAWLVVRNREQRNRAEA